MKRLTIFTPTYNRAYILTDLYESLCMQTCHDFEWIVVDDGSTDGTNELVSKWIDEAGIDIRYFFQKNAGKMMAHNLAVRESESELFMCVDSDDRLWADTTVEECLKFWDERRNDLRDISDVCGMAAPKRLSKKRASFPDKWEICHLADMDSRGVIGELAMVLRRDVLEKFPYPNYPGEKFVTDVYMYDQIDREYQFLLYPTIMQDCRYQVDGYTHQYIKLLFDNPLGFRAYHDQCVKFRKKGWLKSVICYIALSLRIGDGKMWQGSAGFPLTLMLLPFGVMKYFYDGYRLSRL